LGQVKICLAIAQLVKALAPTHPTYPGAIVELFPVGHATGKTLEITDSGCAESHLISRSTNISFGLVSG